jgi:uncharacterized UBP type Zn finger protein
MGISIKIGMHQVFTLYELLFYVSLIISPPTDATGVFSYGMEQRLQCGDCKKVRYRVDGMDVLSVVAPAIEKGKDDDGKVEYRDVQLWECLDTLLGTGALEYGCPSCGRKVHALKWVLTFFSLVEYMGLSV